MSSSNASSGGGPGSTDTPTHPPIPPSPSSLPVLMKERTQKQTATRGRGGIDLKRRKTTRNKVTTTTTMTNHATKSQAVLPCTNTCHCNHDLLDTHKKKKKKNKKEEGDAITTLAAALVANRISNRSSSALTNMPNELLGLIESYLPATSLCHLSSTCLYLYNRWSGYKRWECTFQLHYGYHHHHRQRQRRHDDIAGNGNGHRKGNRWEEYHKRQYGGWEHSFVYLDENYDHHHHHHDNNHHNGATTSTTKFKESSILPSIWRTYSTLWDTIELGFLGYYDWRYWSFVRNTSYNQNGGGTTEWEVPLIMRSLRNAVLPELAEYLYFVVGFKPIQSKHRALVDDGRCEGTPHYSFGLLQAATTTMSAWKLACLLREKGVDCLRCGICDCIDVHVDTAAATVMNGGGVGRTLPFSFGSRRDFHFRHGGDEEWMTPCRCPELVHRSCLEKKLGLVPKLRVWEEMKVILGRFKMIGQRVRRARRDRSRIRNRSYSGSRWNRLWLWLYGRLANGDYGRNHDHYSSNDYDDDDNDDRSTASNTSSNSSDYNTVTTSLGTNSREELAPRVWISYDDSLINHHRQRNNPNHHNHNNDNDNNDNHDTHYVSTTAVDSNNRFLSPKARCQTCNMRYRRSVRLARNAGEVIIASLSDSLSLLRALSTFAHFLLCVIVIAATEGMQCTDHRLSNAMSIMESAVKTTCETNVTLMNDSTFPLRLMWPGNYWKGAALAWWQLQQCCMLHIFFSPRFAAIVDRLWMGPISIFYCRLYFYFIFTSALLAASFLPVVSRNLKKIVVEIVVMVMFGRRNDGGDGRGIGSSRREEMVSTAMTIMDILAPLWDFISYTNLLQYAVVSTTVICIFWRTNFRVFTVADGREETEKEEEGVMRRSLVRRGENRQHPHQPRQVRMLPQAPDRHGGNRDIHHRRNEIGDGGVGIGAGPRTDTIRFRGGNNLYVGGDGNGNEEVNFMDGGGRGGGGDDAGIGLTEQAHNVVVPLGAAAASWTSHPIYHGQWQ